MCSSRAWARSWDKPRSQFSFVSSHHFNTMCKAFSYSPSGPNFLHRALPQLYLYMSVLHFAAHVSKLVICFQLVFTHEGASYGLNSALCKAIIWNYLCIFAFSAQICIFLYKQFGPDREYLMVGLARTCFVHKFRNVSPCI